MIDGKAGILRMRWVIWRVENKSFDFAHKVYCIYFQKNKKKMERVVKIDIVMLAASYSLYS